MLRLRCSQGGCGRQLFTLHQAGPCGIRTENHSSFFPPHRGRVRDPRTGTLRGGFIIRRACEAAAALWAPAFGPELRLGLGCPFLAPGTSVFPSGGFQQGFSSAVTKESDWAPAPPGRFSVTHREAGGSVLTRTGLEVQSRRGPGERRWLCRPQGGAWGRLEVTGLCPCVSRLCTQVHRCVWVSSGLTSGSFALLCSRPCQRPSPELSIFPNGRSAPWTSYRSPIPAPGPTVYFLSP